MKLSKLESRELATLLAQILEIRQSVPAIDVLSVCRSNPVSFTQSPHGNHPLEIIHLNHPLGIYRLKF